MQQNCKDSNMARALLALIVVSLAGQCYGELRPGFYQGKCRAIGLVGGGTAIDVEQFVADLVRQALDDGRIDPAALLRLQFHDCFVRGCDASILLDTAGGEKEADANASVRGFEFIEFVKARLENACAGIVSCADIIALATRDAVALSTNRRVVYDVRTGRRDGLVSRKDDVKLPSPFMTVSQSIQAFKLKKLDANDMVYLLGAHTIGKTHCSFVKSRLYSSGPQMNQTLVQKLKRDCPPIDASDNVPVNLDQGTPLSIDKAFYDQLVLNNGVLQLDQALLSDGRTSNTVRDLSEGRISFDVQFARAMVKLGEIETLTSPAGQIRTTCANLN